MQNTHEPSFAELQQHIDQAERELESLDEKLTVAIRRSALAYLGGTESDEAASIRTQIRTLQDRRAGLCALAEIAEHRELCTEIDRREAAYEKEAQRVEELRRVGTRADRVIEGTGSAFRAAVRADQEERNRDFAIYSAANNAHSDERKAIASLIAHRDELARRVQC